MAIALQRVDTHQLTMGPLRQPLACLQTMRLLGTAASLQPKTGGGVCSAIAIWNTGNKSFRRKTMDVSTAVTLLRMLFLQLTSGGGGISQDEIITEASALWRNVP